MNQLKNLLFVLSISICLNLVSNAVSANTEFELEEGIVTEETISKTMEEADTEYLFEEKGKQTWTCTTRCVYRLRDGRLLQQIARDSCYGYNVRCTGGCFPTRSRANCI